MTELLTDKLKQCWYSRRRKGSFRCESDWCLYCSEERSQFFVQHCKNFLHDSKKAYFITILLGPVTSYSVGLRDAQCAIKRLADLGVNIIGSFELAVKEDTKEENWTNFMKYTGFNIRKHIGIGHLHGLVMGDYEGILKLHFPLNQQVVIKPLGSGDVYSQQPWDYNVSNTAWYMRKRSSDKKLWVDQTHGGQLCFRVEDHKVAVLGNNKWTTVGDGWGESFTRLQRRWVNGSMECRESVEESGANVDKGGSGNDQKGLENCGRMMSVSYTTVDHSVNQNVSNAWRILQEIKVKNVQAISLNNRKVEPAIVMSDSKPVAKIKKRTSKPKHIFLQPDNVDRIISTGLMAGQTLREVYHNTSYMNTLDLYGNGHKRMQKMVDDSITEEEYLANKTKVDGERDKAIKSREKSQARKKAAYEVKRNEKRITTNSRSEREDPFGTTGIQMARVCEEEDIDELEWLRANS